MIQTLYPENLSAADAFAALPNLPGFTMDQCRAHHCDAHLIAIQDDIAVARCSLWWTQVPELPGSRVGVVGHFAACDSAHAGELLKSAGEILKHHGCDLAIGPMDGNTWHRYRLLTKRGPEPAFFLEPDNPDDWPGFFTAAGFAPLATYFSALNEDLTLEDERIPRTLERLERTGVKLRPLNPARFVDELRRIYEVSRVSFQSNFLYTPIAESEFLAQYEPVRAHVRPEMVILAERAGQPVGFVFAIPDLAQAKRGQTVDTVVLKTVAVLPGRAYAGLGNVLVAVCQQQARALGFRRVIHALMHENNNSLNLSGHYARTFRRYALFSRAL
jgi:GNAT superfamily N-acetyltransferase